MKIPEELSNVLRLIGKDMQEKNERLQKAFAQFAADLKNFAGDVPANLKTLASHGWYISGASPIGDQKIMSDEIKNGNLDKVDRHLCKFYKGEMGSIIKSVCSHFPEREKLIKEAQKAHDCQMYFCSIPLFLSTADGILQGMVFKPEKMKKRLSGSKLSEFGALITEPNTITYFMQPGQKDYPFNRSAILHGHDSKFGTKTNSFKAISFLAYIMDFFIISPLATHPNN